MLNWIVRNRTVWSSDCVYANNWCLIELLHSNTWNHLTLLTYVYKTYWPIVLVSRVFTDSPGDWGLVWGCVIPKTQKMVPDATLFNTVLKGTHQG